MEQVISIDQNSVFSMISDVIVWLALSAGIMLILKKLRCDKRKWWLAWIPGIRFYALGEAVGAWRDGLVICILELLVLIVDFIPYANIDDNVETILALLLLAVQVTKLINKIRLYVILQKLFGLRRWWLALAVFFSPVALLYAGCSRKHMPDLSVLQDEEWQAGTAPVEFSAAESGADSKKITAKTEDARADKAAIPSEGLSVNVRSRVVRDFHKNRYLLKDIRLEIPKGSLVLLLGGSGAGKTTLINAITGYEKADADIYLNGKDVYRQYDEVKYRIGFVPQQNLMRMNDTVQDTIEDAANLRMPVTMSAQEKKEKIRDVLEMLGLTAGTDGLVGKKSGGWLRRISIAMELVADPELFILDEPDSGLDGIISRELFERLRDIADTNKIVIAITHTPDRVADLFDKVIVLGRDSGRVGRLCFYGNIDEARNFFGKDTMEGIVMSINAKDAGGEGRADEFIEKYMEYKASEPAAESAGQDMAEKTEGAEV